ncbi:MAG: protein kinase [Anaerolineales bacterium]|nr:protein kinase [Anaerolineales bacterium]
MSSLVGKKINQYHILKTIGHGGVASVFLAYDEHKGREVALKILPPSALDENVRTRFRREAELLFKLNHPNIVQVLDYGLFDGTAYLVLPYFENGTLKDRLDQGPLSLQEGARVIGQLASALQCAHDEGIIHRDVKPSNILFDQQGNALLSDFGFAHLMDGSVNLTGSAMVGTPSYMSPEQIHGEALSPQTDQYALGVILYEISTGSLPYTADSPMAVAIKHATEPVPRPALVNPNLPTSVERVILKALAKEPIKRFPSIQALNDAFQNALLSSIDPSSGKLKPASLIRDPLTIDAPPPILPSGQYAREKERKQRWALLAAFLLFLLACPLSIWAGVSLWPQFFGPEQVAFADATLIYQAVVGTSNAQPRENFLSPDQINTAVAQTLTAADSPNAGASGTDALEPGTDTVSNDGSLSAGMGTTPTNATASVSITSTFTPVPTSAGGIVPAPSPSHTPTMTATPPPSATLTSSPSPTLTSTFTPLATATRTNTPVNPCTLISIGSFYTVNKDVHWTISNGNPAPIVATGASLSWPDANGTLSRVKLGSTLVWSGTDEDPPTSMGFSGSESERTINASAVIEFHFSDPALSSGYGLTVSFSNGCSISP